MFIFEPVDGKCNIMSCFIVFSPLTAPLESCEVLTWTVTFRSAGTLMSGCVLRAKESTDTQMKNTDTTATICSRAGKGGGPHY